MRKQEPPKIYRHEALMSEFNELQVRIKIYLFDLGDEQFKSKHPRPTVHELDVMMNRVMEILKQDNELFRK